MISQLSIPCTVSKFYIGLYTHKGQHYHERMLRNILSMVVLPLGFLFNLTYLSKRPSRTRRTAEGHHQARFHRLQNPDHHRHIHPDNSNLERWSNTTLSESG